MMVTSSKLFLRWNKFWLRPLDCNVDELNMQKGSISVLGKSVFDKCFFKMFLVSFGLLVKVICCLIDLFFTSHIDGKNSSPTAHLIITSGQ